MDDFAIHELHVGAGVLALCPLPGRCGQYGDDLARLRNWQPNLLISMTKFHEMAEADALSLGKDVGNIGCNWLHLPIEDFGTLHASDQVPWSIVRQAALSLLKAGGRVLVHCKGGCGRSGMIVLRLMIEMGEGPEDALKRLRHMRPCAIETDAQMYWAQRRNSPPAAKSD